MHEAFLHAICETPDDDTPRLVYADWLEEHGQAERAEFIRAQIQMTQLAPTTRRYAALRRRARELLAAHGETWLQELPKWARRRYAFQRGFVMHVECTALQFIKHGATLLRAAPVRSVRIHHGQERIAALAASPHLAGLTSLSLQSSHAGDDGAEALAASPNIRHLTRVNLSANRIGAVGMRGLATSPYLSNLTCLNLHGNRGMVELAAAPWLARLTALDLSWTDLVAERRAWLASPYLPRPRGLSLSNNTIRPAVAELLAASPLLEQVVTLDLSINPLMQRGIEALVASPYLANVRNLKLFRSHIGDAGARALLSSPHLRQLRQLDVRHCNIESTRDALQQRFGKRVLV